jgi:hypothetical protein
MRFIVGALALAVLGVLIGVPAAVVLGWSPLSAANRHNASATAKAAPAAVAEPNGETAATIRPKGSFS